jgi:putative DNA primase/helicase
VEYDPEATYDEWADYVDEWTEEGRADALQEYVGYCLHTGAMPIHRALLLVGSGANGKSTFLDVVRALLGSENTTSIGLQTLANEQDAVADFYGSIANVDDDLSSRKLGSGLGMFKKLTSGAEVRGRNLYESGFKFEATGKHLYAANQVPQVDVDDEDEAFWRRWLLVEFPNYYPPNERDSGLADRLTTAESLSGVLNWAIDGWARLVEQGHFTNEETLAHEKRTRWQAWGESVNTFISECVENDPEADRLTTTEAWDRYKAWCVANGYDSVGQRKFTNTLKDENVGYRKSVRINGTPQRGYTALGLSDDVPTPTPVDDDPDEETDDDTRGTGLDDY